MPLIPQDRLPRLVLLRAAKLCEQGWCQHPGRKIMANGVEARCALIAIADASDELGLTASAAHALRLTYKKIGSTDLGWWNDTHGRTQAEVVAMLREVAES